MEMRVVVPAGKAAAAESSVHDRKRFRNHPLIPSIEIGPDGAVREISDAARLMLECKRGKSAIDFFGLVHDRQLAQVMRDVAGLSANTKNTAEWLLRLRTGSGSWRWFKAIVRREDNGDDVSLVITLRDPVDLQVAYSR